MYERNDLRTRGVETWVQTQKVEKEMSDEEDRHKDETEKVKKEVRGVEPWSQKALEKETSDKKASHKEEIKKVEENRKKGRKKKLKKVRKKLEKAQKAQIIQHPHAKEIARKVQIQAEMCIRLMKALRVKKKNVGLELPQFQYKDVGVGCIKTNGKYTATKHQEAVSSEEVEVKEDKQITFPAQETIEKEDEGRLKEKEEVEKLKKDEKKMSGDEVRCSREAEKAKKEIEKKEVNHSERSEEECKKLGHQARPKVPMADKGMIHARYKIKHKVVKCQEERRVDKHSAETQQIASMEYSVPAPMKFGMIIRGLNLAETQVHITGSRHGIRAVDLKEQTVEVSKASTNTDRVLPKTYKNWNEDNATESPALVKENHGEESSDETGVTQTEKLSEEKLSHIGATRGGTVTRDIMKVCSGKLVPSFQRLCSSALECLLEDYTSLTASKTSQRLFLTETVKQGRKGCSMEACGGKLMSILQGLCLGELECSVKDYSALTISKISQKPFLAEAVEKHGEVTDFFNPGRGFAFIAYSTAEEAQACIKAMDNTEVGGRSIQMNIARPKGEKPAPGTGGKRQEAPEGCKLLVHGITQETDSDDEDAKPAAKTAIPAKPAAKPAATKESSSDEDSSDGEEAPASKKTAPASVAKKVAAKEESSSDNDSSDEEEEKPATKPAAKAATAKEESSDDADSDSEDEKPAPKTEKPAAKSAKKEESSDDSSDESSDEEEELTAKKAKKPAPAEPMDEDDGLYE